MLVELHIENFALIERLDIEFGAGFNVITGETGAGKSIILSALGLILGLRSSTGLIRNGCDYLLVEAVFYEVNSRLAHLFKQYNLPGFKDDSLLIRREVRRTGRSRCFINGQAVTRNVLKEFGDLLVDLHGQHEHQSLLDPEHQRDILDSYAGNDKLLAQVNAAYQRYRATLKKIREHKEETARGIEQQNFYQHQLDEIQALKLEPDELENLLAEGKILAHSEKLATLCAATVRFFDDSASSQNILQTFREIINNVNEIGRHNADFLPLGEKLYETLEALEEISLLSEQFGNSLDFTPERLEAVESRLAVLQNLEKKYQRSVNEIIAYRKKLEDELIDLTCLRKNEQQLIRQGQTEKSELEKLFSQLTSSREQAKVKLEASLIKCASSLALDRISFEVCLRKNETAKGFSLSDGKRYKASPYGLEQVEFLFSANQGNPLKPLARIASGGEISRLMLALKTVIAAADLIPSLVFDEIDVGIGGQIAHKVGEKFQIVSKHHQVIVITHLPQIAARARHHFQVLKEQGSGMTEVSIRKLDKQELISEIARMLGSDASPDTAHKHALELVKLA